MIPVQEGSNTALDIIEGDILLDSNSNRYTIRAVEEWNYHNTPHPSGLARFCRYTYSTQRTPAISAGKRGAPAAKLSSVKGTAPQPISAELANRVELESPFETKQVFVRGTNVLQRLIVEELKA